MRILAYNTKSGRQRKRFGIRFLRQEALAWLTAEETLKAQVGHSLYDRCQAFLHQYPDQKMNPTLLRKVYALKGIKKKVIRWTKRRRPDVQQRFGQL